MAKEKKPVALDLDTYERLSRLAAQLRIDNPGGGFVSMSTAVAKLLDGWKELERIANSHDIPIITSDNVMDSGRVVTGFLEQYFVKSEPFSLQTYAANAEANDPQFLEPENETE